MCVYLSSVNDVCKRHLATGRNSLMVKLLAGLLPKRKLRMEQLQWKRVEIFHAKFKCMPASGYCEKQNWHASVHKRLSKYICGHE